MLNFFPESCRHMFEAAGWFPGRSVEIRLDRLESLNSSTIATSLLREFGGLCVGKIGPGRECATSDIEFTTMPSLDDCFAVADLQKPSDELFPVGIAHHGHVSLFVDVTGRLIVYSIPDGKLCVAGESISVGIERLLLGDRF